MSQEKNTVINIQMIAERNFKEKMMKRSNENWWNDFTIQRSKQNLG